MVRLIRLIYYRRNICLRSKLKSYLKKFLQYIKLTLKKKLFKKIKNINKHKIISWIIL